MNQNTIILIGPKGVGKSTLARHLAAQLKWPVASLDDVCERYYLSLPEIRHEANKLQDDPATQEDPLFWERVAQRVLFKVKSGQINGFRDGAHFKEEMELHALKCFLQDYPEGVLELGAGHAIFEEKDCLQKAADLLSSFSNVIALMPDPSPERSVEVLQRNLKAQGRPERLEILNYYATRTSYAELSTHLIHTRGSSPAVTRRQIMDLIQA